MSVISTLHCAATLNWRQLTDHELSIYLYTPKRLQIIVWKTDGLLTLWASPGTFYLATVFTVKSHNQGSILSMDLFLSMTHHRIHLDPPGLEPLFCILLLWESQNARHAMSSFNTVKSRVYDSSKRCCKGNTAGNGGTGAGMKLTGSKIFPLAKSKMVHFSRTTRAFQSESTR